LNKYFVSLILGCIFNICAAQFLVTSNSELHIKNGRSLYFDIDLENQGSINYETDGELILDQGLDNSNGTLNLNDAVLKFGSGTANANGSHDLTFNNTNDTAKFVELNHNGSFNVSSTGFLRIIETFTSNSGTLNADDKIVLVSGTESTHPDYEATNPYPNTAIVPESTGGNINGMRVERYFRGNRAWRFLSSPIDSDDSIFDNWQQGGLNPGDGGYLEHIGTHITGGSAADGFDQNASGNTSLFNYDNSGSTWTSYDNTNVTTLEVGQNYYTLVRGDRSVDLTINDFGNSPETVLRSTGSLYIGDFDRTYNTISTGEYIATGNPYQAPVDMNQVRAESSTSFTDEMWVWVQESNTTGQYALITLSTGDNSLPGLSNANEILQPSQAVFVQANTNSPTINYRESHKVDNSNLTDIFSSNSINNYLRIGLYGTEETPLIDIAYDGLLLLMDNNYETAVNIEDGEKFFNNEENLAIQYGTSYLTADKRKMPTDLDEVIDLYINNIDAENYNLSIELTGFEDLPHGLFLWDKYYDTYTPLSNGLVLPIDFDITIPETLNHNRFAITFKAQSLSTQNNIDNHQIGIYPNEFEDVINLNFGDSFIGETIKVKIYDVLGKIVYLKNIENTSAHVKLTNLALSSGSYILNISNENLNQTYKLIRK